MGAATAGYCVGNLQLDGYPLVRLHRQSRAALGRARSAYNHLTCTFSGHVCSIESHAFAVVPDRKQLVMYPSFRSPRTDYVQRVRLTQL